MSHSLQMSMQYIESTVGLSYHFKYTNCHVDKHVFLRPGHFFLTISICITVTLSQEFVANRIISTKKPIFMTENGLQHLNWLELLSHLPTLYHLHLHHFWMRHKQSVFFFIILFFIMHGVPEQLTHWMWCSRYSKHLYAYMTASFLVLVNNVKVTM